VSSIFCRKKLKYSSGRINVQQELSRTNFGRRSRLLQQTTSEIIKTIDYKLFQPRT